MQHMCSDSHTTRKEPTKHTPKHEPYSSAANVEPFTSKAYTDAPERLNMPKMIATAEERCGMHGGQVPTSVAVVV
eukprot:4495530-Amphidinium_carterae.1